MTISWHWNVVSFATRHTGNCLRGQVPFINAYGPISSATSGETAKHIRSRKNTTNKVTLPEDGRIGGESWIAQKWHPKWSKIIWSNAPAKHPPILPTRSCGILGHCSTSVSIQNAVGFRTTQPEVSIFSRSKSERQLKSICIQLVVQKPRPWRFLIDKSGKFLTQTLTQIIKRD